MKICGATVWNLIIAFLLVFVCLDRGNAAVKLDADFGQDGFVIKDSGFGDDEALALALQVDGKILVAGFLSNGAVKVLAIARYLADGTPDSKFGVDGIYTQSIGNGNTIAQNVVLQKDGKVVVVGVTDDGSDTLFVLRLTSEGNLDKSFAEDGQLLLGFESGNAKNSSALLTSDESVLVAGTIQSDENFSQGYFVKITNVGELDNSFGSDGIVLIDQTEGISLQSLVFWEGEKILAGGSIVQNSVASAGVVSINWDGAVDETFGDGGQAILDANGLESGVNAILVDNDTILIAGYKDNGSYKESFIAEMGKDGSVVPSFGTDIFLLNKIEHENIARALAVHQDGFIRVTGFVTLPTGKDTFVSTVSRGFTEDASGMASAEMALTRTLATSENTNQDDVGSAITFLPDGKVLVAGSLANGNDADFVLMRFVSDESNDTGTIEDNDNRGVTTSGYHVTTEPVVDITRVTAVSGGNIIDQGTVSCTDSCQDECGSEEGSCFDSCYSSCTPKPTVVLRGVCFNIKRNPTYQAGDEEDSEGGSVENSGTTTHIFPQDGLHSIGLIRSGHTEDGTGVGAFTSNIEEISPGVTYYLRAFAVLSDDTVIYGNEVSFQSDDACFIATAVYGSIFSKHVVLLREFRDRYLMRSKAGQNLVGMYYHFSPPVAEYIDNHRGLKPIVQILLIPAIMVAAFFLKTTLIIKLLLLAGGVGGLVFAIKYSNKIWSSFCMPSCKIGFTVKSAQSKESGFTLIELLVVLVIIGILAGYIGPKIMGHPEEAKRTKANLQIQAMETALKMYKLDNGVYPSTEQGLQALVEPPATGKLPAKWREGGYLEKNKIPLDPWGNSFVYLSPGVNNDFDLSSYGADGEPGGESDAKDINNWEIE